MLRNFYTVAVRILLKHRLYTFINTSGLALGMTAFVLIGLYVSNERSYDNFHEKGDRIFRIKQTSYAGDVLEGTTAGVGAAVGPDLKAMYPEVKSFVRLRRNQVMLQYNDKVFRETGVFFASEDFFNVFSVPLVHGVDSLVLRRPWTMAISESFAKKYFGNEDPVGKVVTNIGRDRYEVTGVYKDIPENSHLRIDAVFSFASLELIFGKDVDPYLTSWGWLGYPTYLELAPGTDPKAFEAKLPTAIEAKAGELLRSTNQKFVYELQPIESIHLNSHFSAEIAPNGDARATEILAIAAALILIMAWINYIGLTTARSLERAREVGIRKVLGSSRAQLVKQFLVESLLYNVAAFVIMIVVVNLVLPSFSSLVGRNFTISFELLLYIVPLGVLGSGLYPAFVMSSYQPAKILKGSFRSSATGNILRKGLVVVQFATSVILISGTLVIYQQLDHMLKTPVGVDLDQVLVIEGPIVTDSLYDSKFQNLKNEVSEFSGVESIAASSAVPGRAPRSGSSVRLTRQSSADFRSFDVMFVDHDYAKTFGLSLAGGRDFSRDFNDGSSIMINETGLRALGFTDPEKVLGEKALVYGDTLTIVGVLKDYRHESMRDQISSVVYWCETRVADFYSFRLHNPESMRSVVEIAEASFKGQFPGNQFIYFFLDDLYDQQYQSEQKFGKVFMLFAAAAIFIACLGLYGLSSYLVLLRSKEIGVRKIFGASVGEIISLISREFVIIVLIGIVVAIPSAWYLTEDWLSGYASRINISITFFVVPGVLALLLAIVTVASQSMKAAKSNPIDVIREN